MRQRANAMPPAMRCSLRRSYRCPCSGERHDLRPYRLTSVDLDADYGEQSLRDAEEATGTRPPGCPTRSLFDPFVLEIIDASAWSPRQLAEKYGGPPPSWVVWGIGVYERALNSVQVRDMRADRAERDEEQRKAALAKG